MVKVETKQHDFLRLLGNTCANLTLSRKLTLTSLLTELIIDMTESEDGKLFSCVQ